MYHHILRTAREKICAGAGKESSDPSLGHKDTVSQSVCRSVGQSRVNQLVSKKVYQSVSRSNSQLVGHGQSICP